MGLGDGNWEGGGGRYRLARGLYGTVCILAGQTVAFVLALKKNHKHETACIYVQIYCPRDRFTIDSNTANVTSAVNKRLPDDSAVIY